eukprot:UN03435
MVENNNNNNNNKDILLSTKYQQYPIDEYNTAMGNMQRFANVYGNCDPLIAKWNATRYITKQFNIDISSTIFNNNNINGMKQYAIVIPTIIKHNDSINNKTIINNKNNNQTTLINILKQFTQERYINNIINYTIPIQTSINNILDKIQTICTISKQIQ